jgi:predicted Zn finger-like uncharacterized protein
MLVEITCPHCRYSAKIATEKIPAGAKRAVCPQCRQRFELQCPTSRPLVVSERDPGGSSTGAGERGAPWENRALLGVWSSIFATLKAVLFSPETFFHSLGIRGGIREPFAFGLLMGSATTMFSLFWKFLVLSGGLMAVDLPLFGHSTAWLVFLILLVFVPVFVTVSMFTFASILHLMLLLVRGGGNGFEASFRVIAYSQTAQIWTMIPFLGMWIGFIWQFIVQVIGLREIHQTSYLRVIAAFLIPVILFFLLLAAILIPLVAMLIRGMLA